MDSFCLGGPAENTHRTDNSLLGPEQPAANQPSAYEAPLHSPRYHRPHARHHHRDEPAQELCIGVHGAERCVAGRSAAARFSHCWGRTARARRRSSASSCGIVNPTSGTVLVDGHDIVKDYRASRALIGLVPQELTTDAFETVWDTVSFSRGLFGKPANPAHIEKTLRSLSLMDKKDNHDPHLVGRHEAAAVDCKSAVARADGAVPGRADGRGRRGAAARHVGTRARPARERRDDHPDHALHR